VSGRPRLEFDPAEEEAEIRAYLGDSYDHSLLEQYERTLDEEFAASADEQAFYRTSQAYLYNLSAFAMSGTKLPYLEELTRHVAPGSRLLDYGCGIGSDGLILLRAGYDVEFADFDNPSVAYLRWRLEQRGIEAPIHDLDVQVPAGFDAAYSFDVIEHVEDPISFLSEMERRARIVEVNFLGPEPDDYELHHELPIRRLLGHAGRRDLLSYRLLYGRSHLVLYRPEAVGTAGRFANVCRIGAGMVAGLPGRVRHRRGS